jgi:hypothetical protein
MASSGAGESGPGGGARLSCYNCFALFFVGGGFTPRPQSIEGGAQSSLSLSSKAFCSSACYDLASMAALRREAAAKSAIRSDEAAGALSAAASPSAALQLRGAGATSVGAGPAATARDDDGDGDAPLDGEYSAAGDGAGSSGGSSSGGASSLYGSAPLSHSPFTEGAATALAEFAEAAALSAAREVSDAAASRRRAAAAAAAAAAEAERGRERERERDRKRVEDGAQERKVATPRKADDIWTVEFGEYV